MRGQTADELIHEFEKWIHNQICPTCSEHMLYWEGQIDETEEGEEIRGFYFYCPNCDHRTTIETI